MKSIHAIASHARPVSTCAAFECPHCGRVYEEPVSPNGCFSDDCPGHDTSHDEPVSALELMQWDAEDSLHRAKGRYVRPVRTPRISARH